MSTNEKTINLTEENFNKNINKIKKFLDIVYKYKKNIENYFSLVSYHTNNIYCLEKIPLKYNIFKFSKEEIFKQIFNENELLKNKFSLEFLFSYFFRDYGKIISKNIKENKIYYKGYIGTGFYLIRDFLDIYKDDLNNYFNHNIDFERVLKLILSQSLIVDNIYTETIVKIINNENKDFKRDFEFMFLLLNKKKYLEYLKIKSSFYLTDTKEKTNIKKHKKLIAMHGPAGAGKTTFVKNNLSDYYIISRDDIIENYAKNIFGPLPSSELFRKVREHKLQKKIDQILFDKMKESKQYDRVVIDMTNTKKHRQKEIHNYYKDYYKVLLILNSGLITILKRNDGRKKIGKKIDPKVIISMMKRIDFSNVLLWDDIQYILF